MRFSSTLCVALLTASLSFAAHAAAPSLEEVLQSSAKHFPAIQQAKAKRDAAEAQVQASLGAFDFSLENQTDYRASGFYTGKQTSSKFVKPLQDLNARVSAGYRVSDGSFPIYDDYLFTNNDGEFNLEVFLSLLRDRDIDDDRLALWNNRLNVSKSEQQLLLEKIATQNAAMKAYFEWLGAAEIYSVNKQLLGLAQERQKGLKTRSAQGDVASILLTENSQYIFRREGLLNDAARLLTNAATNLALYWRDGNGAMLTEAVPDRTDILKDTHVVALSLDANALYENRPDLRVIDVEISKFENELKAAENRLLPRADLVVRSAQDIGGGSPTRRGTENIVGLSISIPLQNNTAEGRISKSRAELKSLEIEREFLRNKIAQQLSIVENNLSAAKRMAEITANEKEAARKMQVAEQKIFANGGSDFFVLNMREEQLANAQIKHITALLELHRVLADYYAITVDRKALFIQ